MFDDASSGRIPVLVIGGGPVGCAFALDLAHRGHPPVVVEPAVEIPTHHPRGANVSMRTMEHFRRWGSAEALKAEAAGMSTLDGAHYVPSKGDRTIFADSVLGDVLGVFPFIYGRTTEQYYDIAAEPCISAIQPKGHRIMRERAMELGAQFLLGWTFGGITEHEDHVAVTIRHVETGEEKVLEATYVVGCDGANSPSRRAIGIEREGPVSDTLYSVIVRLTEETNAQLLARMKFPIGGFMLVANDTIFSNAAPFDDHHWRFNIKPGHDGYQVSTEEEILGRARALFGEDVGLALHDASPYRSQLRVAKSYQTKRCFFAGDAVHLFPPTGGQNQNLGIGDAVNLAWKLTGVLEGWAPEAILQTYDAERRPFGWMVGRTAFSIAQAWPDMIDAIRAAKVPPAGTPEADAARHALGEVLYRGTYAEWVTHGMVLDIRYEDSPLILADGTTAPEWSGDLYTPLARPGHRAPHFRLTDESPIYDRFGPAFTLLSFAQDAALRAEFAAAAAEIGVPLEILLVDHPKGRELYGADHALIRPDQQVAWRGDAAWTARQPALEILRIATGHGVDPE